MALQGYLASIKAQSSATVMTDEATTGAGNLVYTITDTAKLVIDLNTDLVVEDSGTVTTEAYTVDYLNGVITFADAVSRTITVTGAYVTLTSVAIANSVSLSLSADMLENTVFGDVYKTFQSGLVTGTADLGGFFAVDDIFNEAILAGTYMVLEYYADATHKFRFYALATSVNTDSPVAGLITESMSYQLTTQLEV